MYPFLRGVFIVKGGYGEGLISVFGESQGEVKRKKSSNITKGYIIAINILSVFIFC